jgi:hypothetical protein
MVLQGRMNNHWLHDKIKSIHLTTLTPGRREKPLPTIGTLFSYQSSPRTCPQLPPTTDLAEMGPGNKPTLFLISCQGTPAPTFLGQVQEHFLL